MKKIKVYYESLDKSSSHLDTYNKSDNKQDIFLNLEEQFSKLKNKE
jgi:hypothetical protein